VAVSKWSARFTATIDGVVLTFTTPTLACGLYFIGGSKSALRRPLPEWDVLSTPDVGDPVDFGADTINDAYIEWNISSVFGVYGPTAFPVSIHRMVRDWNTPSWNEYDTTVPLAWGTAGADNSTPGVTQDIDATTPTPITSNYLPNATGAASWGGMLPLVLDAYASRLGIVRFRARLADESNNGAGGASPLVDRMAVFDPSAAYLCVDYTPAEGEPEPDEVPGGVREVISRPEHDPLALVRADEIGNTLRAISQTNDLARQLQRVRG
jgi:hypothetical protein